MSTSFSGAFNDRLTVKVQKDFMNKGNNRTKVKVFITKVNEELFSPHLMTSQGQCC